MSKEKAYVGKAYRTTTIPDTPQAGAPAEDDNALQHRRGTPAAVNENEGARRGGHQEILPGILGKQLRAAYSELLNAPIPDRISDLIKQLEQKEVGRPVSRGARSEEETK